RAGRSLARRRLRARADQHLLDRTDHRLAQSTVSDVSSAVVKSRSTQMQNTASLFDLTGKVVIVTGSTKGIGRAMAEGLASAGASVVVSSRKQELCEQVAKEIANATGSDAVG